MSNFFENVKKDAKGLEEKLLGPDYKYFNFINTPAELGMSAEQCSGKAAQRNNYILSSSNMQQHQRQQTTTKTCSGKAAHLQEYNMPSHKYAPSAAGEAGSMTESGLVPAA